MSATQTQHEAVDAEGVPLAFHALVAELGDHATAGAVAWLRAHPEASRAFMPPGVPREVAAERASSFLVAEFSFEITPLILDLIRTESGKMDRREGLAAARALGELVIQQICDARGAG